MAPHGQACADIGYDDAVMLWRALVVLALTAGRRC